MKNIQKLTILLFKNQTTETDFSVFKIWAWFGSVFWKTKNQNFLSDFACFYRY